LTINAFIILHMKTMSIMDVITICHSYHLDSTIGCSKSSYGYAYFYSFFLIMNLVFLNLFIAIILDAFSKTQVREERVVNHKSLTHFKDKWSHFDEHVFITFILLTFHNRPQVSFKCHSSKTFSNP
jgi:hypothetical protein